MQVLVMNDITMDSCRQILNVYPFDVLIHLGKNHDNIERIRQEYPEKKIVNISKGRSLKISMENKNILLFNGKCNFSDLVKVAEKERVDIVLYESAFEEEKSCNGIRYISPGSSEKVVGINFSKDIGCIFLKPIKITADNAMEPETILMLYYAIVSLDIDYYQCLLLRYCLCLSKAAIAMILKCSIHQVYCLLNDAIVALQDIIVQEIDLNKSYHLSAILAALEITENEIMELIKSKYSDKKHLDIESLNLTLANNIIDCLKKKYRFSLKTLPNFIRYHSYCVIENIRSIFPEKRVY